MSRIRGGHQAAARAVAVLSALFWSVLFFGLIDLAVPIDETPGFYPSYLLETGWGVLYTFVVGAGFAVLAARPAMVMPVVQLMGAALCLGLTAVAAGSWIQLVPATALAANAWGVVALAGDPKWLTVVWRRPRLDPLVGPVALSLLPPAVVFSIDMIDAFRTGRPPLDDDTWGIDHWPTQAAMALAVAAVAAAVAVGVRARWSGAAPSAACVAVTAGWFGYWSAAYPGHAGSAGQPWGIALIVWAVVFLGVVGWRLGTRTRTRTRRSRT